MVSNRTKRNIYHAVFIASVIGQVAFLVSKLCGVNVNMWLYGFDTGILLVSGIFYSSYIQAVKEDEKYGERQA